MHIHIHIPTAMADQILPVPDPVDSYWLSEPHELSNLRSTPDLPPECDILIIGSGMAGITTAYHILEGHKDEQQQQQQQSLNNNPSTSPPPSSSLLVLEARHLCSGATARNGGHCKAKVSTLTSLLRTRGAPAVDALQAYVQDVIDGLKRLVEDEDEDGQDLLEYAEFELRRTFDVFLDSEEAEDIKRVYEESRREGRAWTRNVSWIGAKYAERVTSIRGAVAAFSGPACSFWPYKLAVGLLARLVERYPPVLREEREEREEEEGQGRGRGGANRKERWTLNVQTHTPATSVTIDEEGRNVVATPRGTVRAKKLVFATNAYTAGLLPRFQDVIVPMRGMASHLCVPTAEAGTGTGTRKKSSVVSRGLAVHPHLVNTYNIAFGPDKGVDYLNPRPDGGIVVGGAKWMYDGDRASWYDSFDDSVRFGAEVEMYWDGYMQRTFRGWEDSGAVTEKVWVGIMGITPDGFPHVGRVPAGGGGGSGGGNGESDGKQWVLAGFNGGGMALILTAAKAVARMVRDDVGFEEVKGEFKLPEFFATSEERLKKAGEKEEDMLKRK